MRAATTLTVRVSGAGANVPPEHYRNACLLKENGSMVVTASTFPAATRGLLIRTITLGFSSTFHGNGIASSDKLELEICMASSDRLPDEHACNRMVILKTERFYARHRAVLPIGEHCVKHGFEGGQLL